MIWASMGENMSSGCLTKYGPSQLAQLATETSYTFKIGNNKGTDQTASLLFT